MKIGGDTVPAVCKAQAFILTGPADFMRPAVGQTGTIEQVSMPPQYQIGMNKRLAFGDAQHPDQRQKSNSDFLMQFP